MRISHNLTVSIDTKLLLYKQTQHLPWNDYKGDGGPHLYVHWQRGLSSWLMKNFRNITAVPWVYVPKLGLDPEGFLSEPELNHLAHL